MFESGSENRYPSDWNKRRKKVYRRDDHKCQKCGRKGGRKGSAQLHAHHITPVSEGGSHKYSNLMTVCHSCHEDIHGHRIPTKEKSKSAGNTWKKLVWLPAWETSLDSEQNNADVEQIFEPFKRENARSKGDWIARLISLFTVVFVLITPGLLSVITQPSAMSGGILIDFLIIIIMPIILIMIPILGIPLIIISLLCGLITWFTARYILENCME